MSRQKSIHESLAEIKTKYPKRTIGFIEFYDGDEEGRAYAYSLHMLLLKHEGYTVSLSKMQLSSLEENSSSSYGQVEIGDLDSGIRDFHAFRLGSTLTSKPKSLREVPLINYGLLLSKATA